MDQANEHALAAFADVFYEGDRETPLTATELLTRLNGCSAILSLNGYGASEITAEVVRAVGTISIICIAHYWGQFANMGDVTKIVEGSNAGTLAVAEWTIASALLGVRKLHDFDRRLKARSTWGEPRRSDSVGLVSGSIAGLIGLGRIGLYAARYFRFLGASVIAYSRSCPPERATELGIKLVSLDELLRTADIVSLHHRVVDGTRDLLGAREFSLLKYGCIFINSARAELYDESALIRELQKKRFTAFIDVFGKEPIAIDHPFRSMSNVVITPHIAGNNTTMFRRCGKEAIQTLQNYFEGKDLLNKKYFYP